MSSTLQYGANVSANGIRQHYLRYGGKGPSLIVIPGITSPAPTWGFVAERLGRSFDTFVLDVRGRGLSERGAASDYSLDTYAKDVAEFAVSLGLNQPMLLGHSMGARIATRAARQYGPAFGRIVLVDPPVSGPGRRPYPKGVDGYIQAIQAAKKGMDFASLRRASPTWSDRHLRVRAEWLHTCDEVAVRETHRNFHDEDIHGDLPKIANTLLLVVAGDHDVIREADVEEIKELAPSIAIRTVENATHMIPWDNYDGFFAAIDEFLLSGAHL